MEAGRLSVDARVREARTSAVLGFQVAMGEVQSGLGPDKRITANASSSSVPVEGKEHWLGVWSSNGTGAVEWMVSGDETPDVGFGDSAELVGSGSAGESVKAPKVSVGAGGVLTASYAYWVSDLSQKALVNLRDRRLTETGYDFDRIATLNQPGTFDLAGFPGLEGVSAMQDPTPDGESLRKDLSKLISPEQLGILDSNFAQSAKDHFHDLTGVNFGLQTNVVAGGMKTDLSGALSSSLAGEIYPEGPPWELLKDFLSLQSEVADGGILPQSRYPTTVQGRRVQVAPNDTLGYPVRHGIAPVVLFWEMGVEVVPDPPAVYSATDPIPLQLRVEPVIVMLNPYDVALDSSDYVFRITSGSGTYDPAARKVERYPKFEMKFLDQNFNLVKIMTPTDGSYSYGNYLNEWLPGFTGHGASDGTSYAYNSLRVGFLGSFEPGEVKVFSLDSDQDLPGTSEDFVLRLAEGEPAGYFARSGDISASLGEDFTGQDYDNYSSSGYTLRLRLSTGAVVGSLYIDSVDTEYSPASENLTSTQQVRLLQPLQRPRIFFGAALKGPNDLINSERNPASVDGAKTLASYNVRSHYQSTLLPGSSLAGDFRSAPSYSPRTDTQSFYNGVASLWDGSLYDYSQGESRMVLFHLPQDTTFSLAELQHADLSFSVYYPTYAIGNSVANPWIPGNDTVDSDTGLQDLSYLLNESLYDGFYFSTVPQDSSEEAVPENVRLSVLKGAVDAELRDSQRSANWIFTEGPLNVNSLSVEVWTAFLGSMRDFPVRYRDIFGGEIESDFADAGAFGRSPLPADGAVPSVGGNEERPDVQSPEYWRGFRNLTDDQIRNLAGQIVHQVKERGPFFSLADFVNRDPQSESLGSRLRGALQAAIDSENAVVIDGETYQPASLNPLATNQNAVTAVPSGFPDSTGYSVDFRFPEAVTGLRSEMAPGYLNQADILIQLGPLLTVRGDTFLIRSYGESVSPLTGEVLANARCEVLVQRVPSYLLDPSQSPEEAANALNERMGRKFRVLSFRWLEESGY
ncbi:hypothetical protein J3R74_004404 [Puniceicoccus vermicola]|uniref:Uncharacterized protein n=2 Tax=Puniceicoccus vermicola TaxID=388746 RepID=A0A7X1B3R0_9BACT|nr:hypothetical protein [Puniceicoccus vermicola]